MCGKLKLYLINIQILHPILRKFTTSFLWNIIQNSNKCQPISLLVQKSNVRTGVNMSHDSISFLKRLKCFQ